MTHRHFSARASRSAGILLAAWTAWSVVAPPVTVAAESFEWTASEGFRSAPLPAPAARADRARAGFTRMEGAVTGLAFTNRMAQQRHLTNQVLLNGSGVALGDVDGDGWCDVYLCGLDSPNRLFRNLGGWRFEDITERAGVAAERLTSSAAVLADLDGDGDLDLAVNSFGQGTHLFYNLGDGRFRRVTTDLGLNAGLGGMTMAWGDMDGDGFLDCYIANYRTSALMDMPQTHFQFATVNGRKVVARVNGRPVSEPDLANRYLVTATGGVEEMGEPDMLYRNLGGTNFVRVSFTDGMFFDEAGRTNQFHPLDWGLSVAFRDLNGDRWPDLYVCNDFEAGDRIWLNRGDGTFQAAPRLAFRKFSMFSMGVDFADINRDGFEDLVVLDMLSRDHTLRMDTQGNRDPFIAMAGEIGTQPQYMMNTLYLNRGDGTYAEIAQLAGVDASDWSWAAVFLDVDLDGWEDLLVSNGHERTARSLDMAAQMRALREGKDLTPAQILDNRKLYPRLDTPNAAFRNRGDLTFEDAGARWGFDLKGVSYGMALGDLDSDGDLDVVVNNLNDPAAIFRNDALNPRVAVRLKGRPPNTQGIGAALKLSGGPVTQSQQVMSGGRYLSSDDPQKAFAAGTNAMTLEVLWRAGGRSLLTDVRAGWIYEVEEPALPASADPPVSSPQPSQPAFADASAAVGYRHHEDMFNDHERQFLQPYRLSQLGPGVAWFDFDRDGREDLIVGSGKGGRTGLFRNEGNGRFQPVTAPPLNLPVTRDQTAVLGWRHPSGKTVLLAGSSNHEDGLDLGSCVRQYDLGQGVVSDTFPGRAASTGPLAMADVDGDGDLDLFVGGRGLPGRYPRAAGSAMFRNDDGVWSAWADGPWAAIPMVSGAVFSDLDGDGDPDLALACDWGPVRVFLNEGGVWREATQSLGLDRFTGWWNGIAAADFDGDGRMDLAVSNWGRNTQYEAWRARGLRMMHGDLDGNGTQDLVECHWAESLSKWVPNQPLDFLAVELPLLRQTVTSHQVYGRMSVEQLLGDMLPQAETIEVRSLDSTVFLNRGGTFEARALPVEAQMAPAFGVAAADLDGDGTEDLVLSQNMFALFAMTPRCDAGRGLWLRGDGRGGFTAVSSAESGIRVDGEQRGCALADYDEDGRVDVALAQNGTELKLFRNQFAVPGLRVRLEGGPGNPHGVGAVLRLETDRGPGPAREIHAGSGYWSQDGAIQVMTAAGKPKSLWVRWPGRPGRSWPIPDGAREVRVAETGDLEVVR